MLRKSRISRTQVESYENDDDIAPLEEVEPGINFNSYVTCDEGLSICVAEVNDSVDLLELINNDFNIEIDIENPIDTVIFFNALHGSETVKTYLMQQDVHDAVFSSLHKVDKELLRVMNQRNCHISHIQYFKLTGA